MYRPYPRLATRWTACLSAVASCWLGSALPVQAKPDRLHTEMAIAAQEIKDRLSEGGKELPTISVGNFSCPTNAAASGGSLLRKVITDELKKLGLNIQLQAEAGLTGEFRNKTDPESRMPAAEIVFSLVDKTGKRIGEPIHPRAVADNSVMIALFGPPAILDPGQGEENRGKYLAQAMERPNTTLHDTKIKLSPESKFAVELVVEDKAITPQIREGLAFAPVKRDQTYAVRLINDSDYDAAVTLTIDGLSMFAFSEVVDKDKQPLYRCVIVAKHSAAVIKGWHITNDKTDTFKVVEYSKSAASQMSASLSSIGTITASFALCWEPGKEAPKDEMITLGADGTGRGPRVDDSYTEVRRDFGKIREVIPVRYTRDE